MRRGDFDATTKASAFIPRAVREMCSLAPIRDVATFPTTCHGPGCEGGARVGPEGASASAETAAARPLTSTTASVAPVSTFPPAEIDGHIDSPTDLRYHERGEQ